MNYQKSSIIPIKSNLLNQNEILFLKDKNLDKITYTWRNSHFKTYLQKLELSSRNCFKCKQRVPFDKKFQEIKLIFQKKINKTSK